MIKKYESYKSLGEMNLNHGDKVAVKYKESKYFMQIGKIVGINTSGTNKGDCTVLMDYSENLVQFYYTNLIKVIELIEVPSGEVLYVPEPDAMDLAMVGLLRHNKIEDYYYFKEEDRWQIEDYSI